MLIAYVLLTFSTNAQEYNGPIKLESIIAFGVGQNFYECENTAKIFFELNDSTRIPFNSWHTFETGLYIKDTTIFLEKRSYRLILTSDQSGIISIENFHADSVDSNGQIVVEFKSIDCCLRDKGRYLFFKINSDSLVNLKCDNILNSIQTIKDSDKKLKIIGISSDSTSNNLALERIEYVKNVLLENGINQNRISETSVQNSLPTRNYFSYGSLMTYYDNETTDQFLGKLELGIVIEFENP
ncbi:hypothetical protein K6119_09830 [Paracrocinitomix mangrovi]|uniref:hypothetical protein n=1 Tax=Paracrocinitomix mangrovi TaxID=2862509 RepID=UPI001C8D5965|nr:hypothetical protein [Paracrocinitomix mangrovi]UKN03789.1 hypothetical protein K6119_09830 [Paracrocinitomix mangrovi]